MQMNLDPATLWQRLTHKERVLFVPVLLNIPRTKKYHPIQFERAAQRFGQLLLNQSLAGTVYEKYLTLRNLLRQTVDLPGLWDQIKVIVKVAWGYVELQVFNRGRFLECLRMNQFAVNSWMDKLAKWVGKGHRFDSARALTETRLSPQLHFVNDRADESDFGFEYFFVHWDAQSVFAQQGSLLGRFLSSRTHKDQAASPQAVAAYLAQHDRLSLG